MKNPQTHLNLRYIRFHHMSHSYVWHDSFTCVTWHSLMCDTTYSYASRDAFICVTCLIQTCDMPYSYVRHMKRVICKETYISLCYMKRDLYITLHMKRDLYITLLYEKRPIYHSLFMCNMWHALFICVTCLIHMCDMTHLYVCHDSFICVTCLIQICDKPHSYVWHDSFAGACDMTHSRLWTDTLWCVTRRIVHVQSLKSRDLKTWRTWCVHVYDMTHSRVWTDTLWCVTWRTMMMSALYLYWYRSLLQNIVSFTGLFHKRDLYLYRVWHDVRWWWVLLRKVRR